MGFWRERNGNIALVTAIVLPVTLMFAGAGVDFQRYNAAQSKLQEFADTLALRGARELAIAGIDPAYIRNTVMNAAQGGLADDFNVGAFSAEVVVNTQQSTVAVTLSQPAPKALILSHISPYGDDLIVEATAATRGGDNICVIALKETSDAINAQDEAALNAADCAVLSNSDQSASIIAKDKSQLTASLFCSAGGYEGGTSNFTPNAPLTDCPSYPDPLAARTPPPVGGCDFNSFEIGLTSGVGTAPLIRDTLNPGVYCGGLKIMDFAAVDFNPGIYVIKDGPLFVGKHSALSGQNVGFYLTGADATFTFEKDAEIEITAPKDGPLAGILFFEDRSAPLERNFSIFSEDARTLLGTFYLPRGNLIIDTQKPVADASAYTAIVVRRLELKGKPTLVINSDYHMTDVPVPTGVGPVGAEVYLRD
jgi:hypothetical protein